MTADRRDGGGPAPERPDAAGELLRWRARHEPDAPLVACGGAWSTCAQVAGRAERLAAGLAAAGVRPGDRVASVMGNRIEAVDLLFGCLLAGAVHVPLNIYLRGEFLRYQLVDADPALVVADAAALPGVLELVAGSAELAGRAVVALDPGDDAVPRFAELAVDPGGPAMAGSADDLACILYTSGTTGMPKGCMISSGYLVRMSTGHLEHEWFTPTDTSLCPLPLYHGAAIAGLMDALVSGGRICFEPEFRAGATIDRAREVGATQLYGVGAMALAILATPIRPDDRDHGLQRCVFFPLVGDDMVRFEERFGVRVMSEGYGQTEVLPATMNGTLFPRNRRGAGHPVSWLDVAVVDPADRVLPAGGTGEIVVRPRAPHSIFSGYWRKEAETLRSWRNLWHHTGDLGYFAEDGSLVFVDRVKDSLRRRGENVSSVELERAIGTHPGIRQVAVHAVPAELGEDDIKACLVLEPGTAPTPAELFAFFKAELPYFAVPRYLEVLDELPVNAVGRVLKHRLRERPPTAATVDLAALGLVVDRAERRAPAPR
jgi:crotonobetaine/carnitine-CoA ligase